MGSAHSRLNPSDIRIEDRLSKNEKAINSNDIDKLKGNLTAEQANTRIILSINNDQTIRISAGVSCATQTTDELDQDYHKNKLEISEHTTETSSAPSETVDDVGVLHKHNDNGTAPNGTTENEGTQTIVGKNDESLNDEAETCTETDNEAAYSTDIGFRSDDNVDPEPTRTQIPDNEQTDSTLMLHETLDKCKNDDEGDTGTDGEDNDLTDHVRPFNEVALEKYGKYKIRMSDDQKNCIASSMAFLDTGDAVIIDRSNQKIKFVDKDFQYISAHVLSAKPWAVCTRGTDVYVNIGSTQIQHLTVVDMIIEPIEVFEVKGRCLGVCVLDEQLAVGLQVGEISLLDFKGTYKGIIKLPIIDNKPCNPWHICSTPENNVLVTDSDVGQVYCINKKSELIFRFQGLDTPRATVLDMEGNIVVVGRDKQSGAVVTIIPRDVELKGMLHIEADCKTDIEFRTLMEWETLEFVPYSVCYRKDRIIVFGGIQETLKIMKLR